MMNKKILIFSTNYYPFVGGAEVSIKEITDRLLDFQWDMVVPKMSLKTSRYEKIGNVNIYRVGFGFSFDKFLIPFFGFLKAVSLNKKNNYEKIWSMMASQASVGASFFKMCFPKKKLILTLQEGDEESHLKRYVFGNDFLYKILIKPWYLLVFKKADFVTVISQYLKERAINNGVKVPIKIIPNGVDLPLFTQEYTEKELDDLKNELNKKNGDIFIIHTGRFVKKNAVEDIVASLEFLPKNIKLLLLGIGEDEDNLRKLSQRKNVQDRVIFHGFVDHKEIPKYLKISDIFIRPSLSEGMGNSFIEAMASEIPVIATPVGGIVDFLTNRKTGLFCKVKNPEDIAEKVSSLLKNQEIREEIILNAKKDVVSVYNWEIIAPQMKKVFI